MPDPTTTKTTNIEAGETHIISVDPWSARRRFIYTSSTGLSCLLYYAITKHHQRKAVERAAAVRGLLRGIVHQ